MNLLKEAGYKLYASCMRKSNLEIMIEDSSYCPQLSLIHRCSFEIK